MQEYSTILTFREEWLDERLKYKDFDGKRVVTGRRKQFESVVAFYDWPLT